MDNNGSDAPVSAQQPIVQVVMGPDGRFYLVSFTPQHMAAALGQGDATSQPPVVVLPLQLPGAASFPNMQLPQLGAPSQPQMQPLQPQATQQQAAPTETAQRPDRPQTAANEEQSSSHSSETPQQALRQPTIRPPNISQQTQQPISNPQHSTGSTNPLLTQPNPNSLLMQALVNNIQMMATSNAMPQGSSIQQAQGQPAAAPAGNPTNDMLSAMNSLLQGGSLFPQQQSFTQQQFPQFPGTFASSAPSQSQIPSQPQRSLGVTGVPGSLPFFGGAGPMGSAQASSSSADGSTSIFSSSANPFAPTASAPDAALSLTNGPAGEAGAHSAGVVPGRPPCLLYMDCDAQNLSRYQCIIRQQIELFQATQLDIEANAQGRNRPISLGQVGIRCRHCSHLHPKQRKAGAVYFPSKLAGIYQTAQNMAVGHLGQKCELILEDTRKDLLEQKEKKSSAGGGRKYWSDGATVQGVYEVAGGGLRFRPHSGSSDEDESKPPANES